MYIQNGLLVYSQPWYIQILDITGTLEYSETPGIFRNLAFSELRYIKDHGIFRTRGIFRTLAYSEHEEYSELFQTSTVEHFSKIVNGYNYFRNYNYLCNISFSRSAFYKINIMSFIKTGLIFTSEIFILCKKYRGRLVGGFEFQYNSILNH